LNAVQVLFERRSGGGKVVNATKTLNRRENLKKALIGAAERAIVSQGLRAVRARSLAEEAGCAIGAIYNVVTDLDDLILAVNSRTLAVLERELKAASYAGEAGPGPDQAIARLVALASAYLDFAAANTLRWRAVFEHRIPAGQTVPEWYVEDQRRLFDYVEDPLRQLQPEATPARRALLARSLFSAVHGMVVLGLEEKLHAVPLPILHEQLTFVVSTIGRGMTK
jgi:AcrR family transcriptional regulator